MKYFLILIISIISISINAQSLSNNEVKKLSKLDLEINNIDQYEITLTKHLREILLAEKQRKANKTSGIILTTMSVLSIGYGLVVSSGPTDSFWHGNPQRDTVGGILIGIGLIESGIGIPLLFTSKKRKKQRDSLIQEYQRDLK